MDTKNKSLGGGEILQYMNKEEKEALFPWMDTDLMSQLSLLPLIKLLIITLLVILTIVIILKMLNIKNPFRKKGITIELKHTSAVRKRDKKIIKATNTIQSVTKIVQNSPFAIDKYTKDYLNYNLERAGYTVPGGDRTLKAEEFNAIIKSLQFLGISASILIGVLAGYSLGILLTICIIAFGNTIPTMVLRAKVKSKDDIILENFSDFYLMIHYNLISRTNKTIVGTMKSYDKSTTNETMHEFANSCITAIETYGDHQGPMVVHEKYKEIPVVCKLMRLIKQSNEGADIVQELLGFRKEIIDAKVYELEKRADKILLKARTSMLSLYIILIQAVISAMAIYFDDLGGISSILGGL